MSEFNLLRKTELRIQPVGLNGANLGDVAAAVAKVLGLEQNEVLVTDALGDAMTIDILRRTVNAYNIVGKQQVLLDALSRLPGVAISVDTSICSEGMLGWIGLEEAGAREALKRSEIMAEEVRRRIARRAMVFSTGSEVINGQIVDTNKPMIARCLEAEGYTVKLGPDLRDDWDYIAGLLRRAMDSGGYSLIVTTGGVGAEAKDHTIEALQAIDPQAATPYICHFEIGTGRHAKDGIRIGVAEDGGTLIVALTGPNDEVIISLEALTKGLAAGLGKAELASEIAGVLRQDLRRKMGHGHLEQADRKDAWVLRQSHRITSLGLDR